ncbi:RNA polymerase sigma factor [Nitrosomonas sp. Is35]|uniref:RNA polymerase sigma factor n=1 Tax=Nitrosomonas sp. Is35 TaxID=3080534 RepID=UPI00294B141F|nr:RNA polymerase sigma factor [Nitrosomonas sp. Is35]MDV6346906.1 RNA polymerase sigma factor [Nitrosomonas sp. Is35]
MNSSIFLTQIYLRHMSELRAFLSKRVGCREIAAELTQETFIRIMHYQTGETLQNARAMLYRIAGNLAIDYHRLQIRQPAHRAIDELPLHDLPVSDALNPERIVYARQILKQLCTIIEGLPPQCHRAFILHKFDGLSHDEIASQLGITRNAVEKLLIRALVRLRQILA